MRRPSSTSPPSVPSLPVVPVVSITAAMFGPSTSADSAVDPLADRARRVPALEAHGRQEQVRERVQEIEPHAREVAVPVDLEGAEELLGALFDGRPLLPRADGGVVELDEDALAAHLCGREPLFVPRRQREHRRHHLAALEVVLALQVRADRVEATEADLHPDLAELGHDDEAADPGREIDLVLRYAEGGERNARIDHDARRFDGRVDEAVVLGATERALGRRGRALVLGADRRQNHARSNGPGWLRPRGP